MKKKDNNNFSGISVCDSITMSVRKKKTDLRSLEAVLIAAAGFIAVIMSFLDMFSFKYDSFFVVTAAVIFSAAYITFSLMRKHTFRLFGISFIAFCLAVYFKADELIKGFKFVYNVIYADANKTQIKYYKFLKLSQERECTTLLFIMGIWLLAMVIYTFTIVRPNPIPVIIASFPIIEIGLYNGIHIPIFWGILTVAYWLAVLAMCIIDIGEYSGGAGGFVRKDNFFFPKRHMRLKVTEKCAVTIISSVMIVTAVSLGIMKVTNYERSEKLNQKRTNIKNAVNSFTMDDLASSISAITEAFGFTFDYESHKLGDMDRLTYKNVTDLIVTLDKKYEGAIYLKNYAGGIYKNNEWLDLDYSKSDELFGTFKEYGVYPQDFPYAFTKASPDYSGDMTIWIENKRKKNRVYAPYGTANYGDMSYNYDTAVSSKKNEENSYSYKFSGISAETAAGLLGDKQMIVLDTNEIADMERRTEAEKYCTDRSRYEYGSYFSADSYLNTSILSPSDLYKSDEAVMSVLFEEEYRKFVYDNYLQVPSSNDMTEVQNAFADLIEIGKSATTAEAKLLALHEIKERIISMTEYSLNPGKTPSNRDFVNYFLLENHKGYCTHYATSGVILARMAGIPARYATGYIIVGDDFKNSCKNSDGSYTIKVTDERSHAWTEIYLDGFGWIPFEFTAGYSDMNISPETTTTAETTTGDQNTTTTTAESTEKSSSTKRSRATSRTTEAQTKTTEAVSTAKPNHSGGSAPSDGGKKIPAALIKTITVILIAASAEGAIYLRRILILRRRKKRFSRGRPDRRIIEMYNHSERLLRIMRLVKGNMSYMEFAEYANSRIAPDYAEDGAFIDLVNASLAASFSKTLPTKAQLESAYKLVNDLSSEMYKRANPLRKIYIKIILVIV